MDALSRDTVNDQEFFGMSVRQGVLRCSTTGGLRGGCQREVSDINPFYINNLV